MLAVGQLALDDQVGGLEVVAVLGQVLDRIAAIAQDALVAVDEGDLAAARGGVGEGRVVGHQAEVVGRRLDVAQGVGANHATLFDRHFVVFAGAVVDNRECFFSHRFPSIPAFQGDVYSTRLSPDGAARRPSGNQHIYSYTILTISQPRSKRPPQFFYAHGWRAIWPAITAAYRAGETRRKTRQETRKVAGAMASFNMTAARMAAKGFRYRHHDYCGAL